MQIKLVIQVWAKKAQKIYKKYKEAKMKAKRVITLMLNYNIMKYKEEIVKGAIVNSLKWNKLKLMINQNNEQVSKIL